MNKGLVGETVCLKKSDLGVVKKIKYTITEVHDQLVVCERPVEIGTIRECFSIADFITGDAKIIKK